VKRNVAGVLIAIAILAVLAVRADAERFLASLRGVLPLLLVLGLAVKLLVLWLKAARWAIALASATGRPARRVFRATMIGYAGNMLLPARLGELPRVGVIDKYNRTGIVPALTTIGVVNLFDLILLAGAAVVIGLRVVEVHGGRGVLATAIVGAAAGGLVLLIVARRHSDAVRDRLQALAARLPERLRRGSLRRAADVGKGLGVLERGGGIGRVAFMTLAVWLLEAIGTYVWLLSFRIEPTFLMAAALVVAIGLGLTVPVTPGNAGIAQAISVLVLGAFGIGESEAFAYSLVTQAALWVMVVGLGALFFFAEGMKPWRNHSEHPLS
jgi:uncharacterized protein (TIRG00374 family)